MRVLIAYECSGVSRRAFAARGHDVRSIDLLPSEDNSPNHYQGDVFAVLERFRAEGWWPDLAIFHPVCTYHTVAAAWAFKEPDFARYPRTGGYHQRVQPGTLTGLARVVAREQAEADLERIKALPIARKVIENPRGTIPTRTSLGPPLDVVQPFEFGDDASKATCLWFFDADGRPLPEMQLVRAPALYVQPRMVAGRPRWANQTDSGQNRLSPGEGRAGERSRTYEGIGRAFAEAWG